MSELKTIKIELNNHGKPIASIQGTTSYYGISPNDTFYRQEDADRYINLIEDKAKHKSEEYADTCRFYEGEIRHQKYKRCLDKAEYCKVCSTYYFNVSEIEKDEDKVAEYRNISDWYDKWEERWLELAEKFKPSDSTAPSSRDKI